MYGHLAYSPPLVEMVSRLREDAPAYYASADSRAILALSGAFVDLLLRAAEEGIDLEVDPATSYAFGHLLDEALKRNLIRPAEASE